MSSECQRLANRQNALKSTGPRSGSGKAIVSKNALKHGLLSKETLLADEDREIFESFEQQLQLRFSPVGELEDLLVDRIVSNAWRLRRIIRVESAAAEHEMKDAFNGGTLRYWFKGGSAVQMSTLSRYEANLERSMYRAMHELERLQEARHENPVMAPIVVDVNVSGGENGFVSQNT